MLPGAQHLIPYHAVTRGACWGWVVDEPPVHLSVGDIIVIPHGDAHVLSSAPADRTGWLRACAIRSSVKR